MKVSSRISWFSSSGGSTPFVSSGSCPPSPINLTVDQSEGSIADRWSGVRERAADGYWQTVKSDPCRSWHSRMLTSTLTDTLRCFVFGSVSLCDQNSLENSHHTNTQSHNYQQNHIQYHNTISIYQWLFND